MIDINRAAKEVLEEMGTKTIFSRRVMRRLKTLSSKHKCKLRVCFNGINPESIERADSNTFIINGRSFETAKFKAFISSIKAGNTVCDSNSMGTNLLAACATTLNTMIEQGNIESANTLKSKLEDITKATIKGINYGE